MKERRAAVQDGDLSNGSHSSEEERERRQRRRAQLDESQRGPQRQSGERLEEDSPQAPCKASRFERELLRGQREPVMSPALALHYAEQVSRMGAVERRLGATGAVYRRAEAELADESLALGEALQLAEHAAGGQPLPPEVAARLSAELGVELSAVRVHTDSLAARSAAALGARAFAVGTELYFAAGAYDPSTPEGLELLAHEVAHVAQHLRGAAPGAGRVSRPGDGHEREAESFARAFRQRHESDPAAVVNRVRATEPRASLPFQAELEEHFGTSLGFVETYTGSAARQAAELFSAGAFALRNILVLAEPSPQRETLLHELTHVLQARGARAEAPFPIASVRVGARGSEVEREASHAPAQPTATAAADVIHRDEPTTPPDIDAALTTFCASRTLEDYTTAERRQELKYGGVGVRGYVTPRLYETSAYFLASEFANAVVARHPGITGDMLTNATTAVLQRHKVAKVANEAGRFIVYGDAQTVSEVNSVSVTREWSKYKRAVDTLHALGAADGGLTFGWPVDGTYGWTQDDATYTDTENEKYREAMRVAISRMPRFCSVTGNWTNYYNDVVATRVLRDNRLTGDIFALIVAESAKALVDKTFSNVEAGDPIFDVEKYDLTSSTDEVRGDGVVTFEGSSRQFLVECKALTRGPAGSRRYREKARDYARIIRHPERGLGYTYNGESIEENVFDHVVYFVADHDNPRRTSLAQAWYQFLFVNAGDGSPCFTIEEASIVPAPEGMENVFRFRFNPEFGVTLGTIEDSSTHYSIDAPRIDHPGLSFTHLEVQYSDDKTEVLSGSVTFDVTAGDLTEQGVTRDLTPAAEEGLNATADNQLTGLTSSLQDLLGRVSVEAAIVDEGVRATLTIDPADLPAVAGFRVEAATLTALCTTEGELSIEGVLQFAHQSGQISGQIQIGWNNGWQLSGELTVAAETIPNVSEFTCTFDYADGEVTIGVDAISFEKELGAVTLTGVASDLSYDVTAGSFSGEATLQADLGMFGRASARATIADNTLTEAEFSYDSPEFKYPPDSATPTFSGTIGGTITYSDGAFSGSVRGTAGLNIPALQSLLGEGGLGLAIEGEIDAEGRYSGSISTTTPIRIGDHFEIPSISCDITPEGEVEGDFRLRVVNFRYLESVELGLHVDRNGVSLSEAAAQVAFGSETDRFWGSLSVAYAAESGLTITGELSARIREGMVATGTLTYSSQDNEVDVSLSVEEITLLQHGPVSRTLFELTRQVPVLNVYGIGVYLDLGFDLTFSYQFDLRLAPTISLEGFSLETFEFEQARAEVELRGELVAALTSTPRIGLGLFALSPSLLRGGGGVTIPIVAEARLIPTGTLSVAYSPDGGVTGDAQLAMPLTFGITGSVAPYAELSLLDGVWNPTWEGESLAEFEILPPTELFNFQLDLGGDLSQQEPEIPDAPGPPTAAAGPTLAQEEPTTSESSSASGGRDSEVSTAAPSGDAGGLPTEPVNLAGLASGLQELPGYETISGFMTQAGEAWEAIGGFFGRVASVFRDFLLSLGDAITEIIDGFVQHGLDYLPQLLHRMVGDDVWNLIEPLITALTSSAEALLQLFETTPPTNVTDFFGWALQLAANAWSLAFDNIGALVSALQTMFDRIGAAAVRVVTNMVNQGMVGVRRHRYYIWYIFGEHHFFVANQYKIHVLGVNIDYWDQGGILNPASAVAIGLFEVLERMGVPPVGGYFDERIGEDSRDRWV